MCRIGVLQGDEAADKCLIDILIEPTLVQSNRRQGSQNNFGCVIQRLDWLKNPADRLRQILVVPLGLKQPVNERKSKGEGQPFLPQFVGVFRSGYRCKKTAFGNRSCLIFKDEQVIALMGLDLGQYLLCMVCKSVGKILEGFVVGIVPFRRPDVLEKQPLYGEPLPCVHVVEWKHVQRDAQKAGVEQAIRGLLVQYRRVNPNSSEQDVAFFFCPCGNSYFPQWIGRSTLDVGPEVMAPTCDQQSTASLLR